MAILPTESSSPRFTGSLECRLRQPCVQVQQTRQDRFDRSVAQHSSVRIEHFHVYEDRSHGRASFLSRARQQALLFGNCENARFGEPEDVLFSEAGEFNDWGVLEFRTSDIPDRIEGPDPSAPGFLFFMKHVPHEDNYAHSEIWSDKRQATGEYVEPSKWIRKQFRTRMGQRMMVRVEALI